MRVTKRDVAAGVLAIAGTLGARAAMDAATPMIGETAWDWNKLTVKKTAVG